MRIAFRREQNANPSMYGGIYSIRRFLIIVLMVHRTNGRLGFYKGLD